MDRLTELNAKLAEIDAKLDAIVNGNDVTAEQEAQFNTLSADRKKTVAAIDREQDRLDREAERDALAEKAARASRTRDTVPAEPKRLTQTDRPTAAAPTERRDDQGRVTSFVEETEEKIMLRVGDEPNATARLSYGQNKARCKRVRQQAGYVPYGEFKSASDFIRAGLEGAGRPRFEERVHNHFKQFGAVAGMSEGIGSDGGYTVMPEFSDRIIDRVYSNTLWSQTDNFNVTGNNMTFLANAETSRATGSRHGGLRGYIIGEGGTITSSKPTFREITLKLVKFGVVVYFTNELLSDGGSILEEYVVRKASEEFSFMGGDYLVNGTGAGQPLGILNAPSLISITKETGQPATTLVAENIIKAYSRFYAPNLPRMQWLHNQDIQPQLDTMSIAVGTGGELVYNPPNGLASAPFGTLRGRPLQPTEFNATLGTVGDIIAADLSQMLSINKGGVSQAVSMHVEFLTDQLAMRLIVRQNARPWETAAITPYKGSNTQSSFVAVQTRS